MEEIKNIQDAKNVLDHLDEKVEARENLKKETIQEIMEQIKGISVEEDEFAIITYLLSLPEEQFTLFAPIFEEEFTRSLNTSNNKLLFAETLNASGQSIEDFLSTFNDLLKVIDEEGGFLSQGKKDFLKRMFGSIYNALADTEGIAKKIVRIPIELCKKEAKCPTYANPTDSGLDLYALEDITVAPGETVLVPTGIKTALPPGYEFQVRPKSGRSLKTKLRIANTPGTIDAGYRDEIGVIIENVDPPIRKINIENWNIEDSDPVIHFSDIEFGQSYTIGKGEKFAQLVLNEVPKAAFYQVENIMEIENDGRKGGFGSSGLV